MVGPITSVTSAPTLPASEAVGRVQPGAPSFGSVVERVLGTAVDSRAAAEAGIRDLATGKTDNIHTVLLQTAQADLAFRLVLEIRNRLTEAYQEVMKMQI